MQQFVHLGIFAFSTINAHQYSERHRMMIFMVMFVNHDRFTTATKIQAPLKRAAPLVCTTDESLRFSRRFCSLRAAIKPDLQTLTIHSVGGGFVYWNAERICDGGRLRE